MRHFTTALLCLLLAAAGSELHAQSLAASLRAGTQGIGVALTTPLVPTLNARLGAHFFSYSTDGTQEVDDVDVAYDASGDLFFVSALLDWHPFHNTFRVSGGLQYNGARGGGVLTPNENIEAGNNAYTPEEVGDLNLDVSFGSKVAPYVGLGVGDAVSNRIGFLFDVGVLYAGAPQVDITASGMLSPTAGEAPKIEENVSWARWYPVVSLGISARLF